MAEAAAAGEGALQQATSTFSAIREVIDQKSSREKGLHVHSRQRRQEVVLLRDFRHESGKRSNESRFAERTKEFACRVRQCRASNSKNSESSFGKSRRLLGLR
jgi:hypothetical protein